MAIRTVSSVILGLVVALHASAALAGDAATGKYKTYPKRVCVFDIDDTLVREYPHDDPRWDKDVLPQAQESVKKCVDANYGVAFATTSKYDFRSLAIGHFKKELQKSTWSKYNKVAKNWIRFDYTDVENTASNPLYISATNTARCTDPTGDPMICEGGIRVRGTKGDGMNRLMRTFYGYGVGTANVVDPNNPYVIEQKQEGRNPDKYALSACLVLFDDNLRNYDEVAAFNGVFGTHFQVVKVDPEKGVTPADVDKGFLQLDAHCGIK